MRKRLEQSNIEIDAKFVVDQEGFYVFSDYVESVSEL